MKLQPHEESMRALHLTNILLAIIAAVLLFGRETTLHYLEMGATICTVLAMAALGLWGVLLVGNRTADSEGRCAAYARAAFHGFRRLILAPIILPVEEWLILKAAGAGIATRLVSSVWATLVGLVFVLGAMTIFGVLYLNLLSIL